MRVIICCLLLLGFSLVASCRDAEMLSTEGGTENTMLPKELNRLGREVGLVFPAESEVVHFSEPERFVDPVWVAKIIIPAQWYESFKNALLGKPIDNTVYHGALADSTSWWKPTDVVFAKQYLADRQTFVNIVVTKEGEEFSVYVECAVF